jgi:MFS family permease
VSPTFRSLQVRNYRLYAMGGIVSNTGTWMQRVAQDWLVLQLTHSGVALGITTGLQFLPMLLFAMWGGVLADRYPKRRVLAIANSAMAITATILGLLVITGSVATWHVFVLAFLLGTAAAVENPTRQSFVVEMVGKDDLTNAVGLNSASFNAARIIGPAVAGFLIQWIGSTGPVFLINAASYVAVLLALRAMNTWELQPAPRVPRGKGQLREGLRYLKGRPDLMLVLTIVFFVGTFGLNFQFTNALMATDVFHKQAGGYGVLGSIMAVGSLTGALLAARRRTIRLRLVVGAAIAFGFFELLAGLMPTYSLYALALIPVGVCSLTMLTAANACMQLGVDPLLRGRVMAVYIAVFFGGTPLGAPMIGWVASAFGPRWSLLFGGLVSVVATVVATALLARREGIVVRAHVRPRPRICVRTA